MKAKINSFTVLDLVMALLITSVIISIVYASLFLLNKQFQAYQKKTSHTVEFLLFQKALQHDIAKATFLKDTLDNCLLVLNTGRNGETILYKFEKPFIIRVRQQDIDSFQLEATRLSFDYVKEDLRLVSAVSVTVRSQNNPLTGYFKKQYSAAQLMEAEQVFHEGHN